jgi:cell wall-associated NlpC family hydrolase
MTIYFGVDLYLLFFWACAPHVIRYPGPLMGLGRETTANQHAGVFPVVQKKSENKDLPISVTQEKIVRAARSFLGAKHLRVGEKTFGYHCSGYVAATFTKAGIQLEGSTKHLYQQAKKDGYLSTIAQPGSIVFFDNTYDANKNGRFDDPLSHVAIVERVYSDGRVQMIHLGSKGVMQLTLNLNNPAVYKSPEGILQNSYLRVRTSKEDKKPRLAGQLWRGFALGDVQ